MRLIIFYKLNICVYIVEEKKIKFAKIQKRFSCLHTHIILHEAHQYARSYIRAHILSSFTCSYLLEVAGDSHLL